MKGCDLLHKLEVFPDVKLRQKQTCTGIKCSCPQGGGHASCLSFCLSVLCQQRIAAPTWRDSILWGPQGAPHGWDSCLPLVSLCACCFQPQVLPTALGAPHVHGHCEPSHALGSSLDTLGVGSRRCTAGWQHHKNPQRSLCGFSP